MASLHHHVRSPYFYCAYTQADGRRRFRSTRQKDRKKAWEVCRLWQKAVEASRRGDLTQIQSRKILDEIMASVGEAPMREKSIGEFFTHWLSGKQASKAKSTGEHYRIGITKFLACIGARASKSLSALTYIEDFRDTRFAQGVSASVVKSQIICEYGLLRAN